MTQVTELRGAVLGKSYRIGRRLGAEGENLFEATHELHPGRFLLHLFPNESLTRPEGASRIQRGARVASQLRDARVIQVLDFNASGETPAFVVTERYDGPTLAEAMAEEGMLPVARVVELVEAIGRALTAAHALGLVHGDLRPAHVILPAASVAGAPKARLGGFGWAKELRAVARIPAASGYLAPEQHFGKVLSLDERVDQFALAALAYEMLAACLPFSEESADLADRTGRPRVPPAIADLVPGVPLALDDVLRRALAFSPNDRFPAIDAFIAAFRLAAGGGPIVARAAVPAPRPGSGLAMKPLIASSGADDHHDGDGDDDDGREAAAIDDDDALVLGTAAAVVGEEATQIRRSPFLDDENDDGPREESGELSLENSPFHNGLPAAAHAVPRVPARDADWEQGLSVVLQPPEATTTIPGHAGRASMFGRLAGWRLRAMAAPIWLQSIVGATAVLLVIGVVGLITSASDDEEPLRSAARPLPSTAPSPAHAAIATPVGANAAPATTASGATGAAGAPPPLAVAPIIAAVQPLPPQHSGETPASGADLQAGRHAGARTGAAALARAMARRPSTGAGHAVAKAAPPASAEPDDEPSPCSIHISSRPWAQVWIDGRNTGHRTPLANLGLSCGSHKLELKRPDKGIEQMEMFRVERGKPFAGAYELQ